MKKKCDKMIRKDPLMRDKERDPSDLWKIVRFGCKETCDKRCFYRKAGLNCTSACKECDGLFFNNAQKVSNFDDDDGDNKNIIDIRHFLNPLFSNNFVILLFL